MKVKVVEVSLRDGLQNETEIFPTTIKLELIKRLIAANLIDIEVTSFVHPKWIPQLADAEQLLVNLPSHHKINYRALVPNTKGFERIKAPPLSEIAVFISASQTHNMKNVNKTIAASLNQIKEIINLASISHLPVRAYISCVFGCPYEGHVSLHVVEELCRELFDLGVYEVSLGDTIGVAVPQQVKQVLHSLQSSYNGKLAVHFHDTKGLALVNCFVSLEQGITTFDSSLGGLGGCPYAPGASGNVATEELVTMLHGVGVGTGIDLTELCETAAWLEHIRKKPLPSKVLRSYLAKKGGSGR
jgi:hydroxymethylglutaryl-CoA lyase